MFFSTLKVIFIVLFTSQSVHSFGMLEWFGYPTTDIEEKAMSIPTETLSKRIQIIDQLPEGEQAESVTNLISLVDEDFDSEENDEKKKTTNLMELFGNILYRPTARYAKVLIKDIWHIVDLGESGSIQREYNIKETEDFVVRIKHLLISFFNAVVDFLTFWTKKSDQNENPENDENSVSIESDHKVISDNPNPSQTKNSDHQEKSAKFEDKKNETEQNLENSTNHSIKSHDSPFKLEMSADIDNCSPLLMIHGIAVPRLPNGRIDQNSPEYAKALALEQESKNHHRDTSTGNSDQELHVAGSSDQKSQAAISSILNSEHKSTPIEREIELLGKEIKQSPVDRIKPSLGLLETIYQKLKTEDHSEIEVTSNDKNLKLDIGAPGSLDRQKYMKQAENCLNSIGMESREILSALPSENSPPHNLNDPEESCFMFDGQIYCPNHPDYHKIKQLAKTKSPASHHEDSNTIFFDVGGKKIYPGDTGYAVIKSQYDKARAAGRADEFLNPNGMNVFTHNGEMIFPGHEKYNELKASLDEAKAAAPGHNFNTPEGTLYFIFDGKKIFPGDPMYEKLKTQHDKAKASGNAGDSTQLSGYNVDGEIVFPGDPKYEEAKSHMDRMKSLAPHHDFSKDAPGTKYYMIDDKLVVPSDPMYNLIKMQQAANEEVNSTGAH